LVTLAFPLIVLAIPILDTSFVVLKRLKYRRPITEADRNHLHHRFMDLGFSQRRAVLTMYVWCATLAAAALATRFIPPRPHGHWRLEPTIEAGLIGLAAVVTSVYVVYVLEIVKVANPRIRRRERAAEQRRSA
jgi:UDP-GlcNAc:undecaprenyl-phosphate GlcNAc-1-phosphate transferase